MGKEVVRSNCLVASIFGIIQSVIWLLIHLVSILYYMEFIVNEKIDIHKEKTVPRILEAYFNIFLDPLQGPMLGFYMHAHNFIGVSVAYFLITFAWFCASAYLCWIATRNKMHKALGGLAAWSIITAGLSLFDVIILGFVSFDYNEFNRIIKSGNILFNTAYFLQIILTVRLFVFWFINVTFIVIFVSAIIRKSYLLEDQIDWPGMFNRKLETYNGNNQRVVRPPTPPRMPPSGIVENKSHDHVNSAYEGDNSSLGSRFTEMFADVSSRAGNYRKSPMLNRIPVPPPLTPNPAYRTPSTTEIPRRRILAPSSNHSILTESNYNNVNNRNNDDLFVY